MSQTPDPQHDPELTPEQLHEIERRYDPELAFRPTGRGMAIVISVALASG